MSEAAQEKDPPKEIWRERPGDFYSDSVEAWDGKPGLRLNAGGTCVTKTVREWVALDDRLAAAEKRVKELVEAAKAAEPLVAHLPQGNSIAMAQAFNVGMRLRRALEPFRAKGGE